jgi:hypothetical protein
MNTKSYKANRLIAYPLLRVHAGWRLVLLFCLCFNACSSEQGFLLFLDQGTTMTAPDCHAVIASTSFDAVAGSHVTSLREL